MNDIRCRSSNSIELKKPQFQPRNCGSGGAKYGGVKGCY